MITPLKLRIQFKMETGEYPVWETVSRKRYLPSTLEEKQMFKPTFRGNLKSIYGKWLEKKSGNYNDLRWRYKMETGYSPINKTKIRPYWDRYGWHNKWGKEKFTVDYSLWLEELYIQVFKAYFEQLELCMQELKTSLK